MEEDGVCRIYDVAELGDDERLVVFRTSYNDFHYIRQISNGAWTHKTGASTIKYMGTKEVFDKSAWISGSNVYYGESILLAVNKDSDRNFDINEERIDCWGDIVSGATANNDL